MNEGPVNKSKMIETTDCLEAVGVFRGWKNFFFLIVVICLLLSQVAFWLWDLGVVSSGLESETEDRVAVNAAPPTEEATATGGELDALVEANRKPGLFASLFGDANSGHLERTVELVNGILIVAVGLYCMAMFFSLMVSLIGRLGGISHISRAFFLSLILLMLVIPWQKIQMSVVGVIYLPTDLYDSLANKSTSVMQAVLHYLRFTGYWLIVMLVLLLSQARSARWTKSMLRRLEII
jgi:hypothetical protein